MVVTKHFAVHGNKYRKSLIKYILNPDKTDQLKLVSDFGMSNYLDFPNYEEMVEIGFMILGTIGNRSSKLKFMLIILSNHFHQRIS